MTTTYSLSISKNPQFQTVTGLTNQVFDRNNIVSGQMATEAQIQQLWQDIITLEQRIDYCCRDIVYWDIQVRIRDKYGNIITDYLDNRTTGIARRGKNFTMTFPLKAVPKYEQEKSAGIAPEYFVDGDRTACVLNGIYTLIHNFCSLLYRGNSGQYFEMSNRKTVLGLAVGAYFNYTIDVKEIMADGTERDPSSGAYVNKLFAEISGQDDITIKSFWPIDSIGTEKTYGRVFRFDFRDVTLGG